MKMWKRDIVREEERKEVQMLTYCNKHWFSHLTADLITSTTMWPEGSCRYTGRSSGADKLALKPPNGLEHWPHWEDNFVKHLFPTMAAHWTENKTKPVSLHVMKLIKFVWSSFLFVFFGSTNWTKVFWAKQKHKHLILGISSSRASVLFSDRGQVQKLWKRRLKPKASEG